MSAKLLNYPPQYLRGRARQTRAMAGTTSCDATLIMLEQKAAEYDRMAALLEGSANPEPPPGKPAPRSESKPRAFRLELVRS